MILRKPYKFLIKHFKLIHLLLSLPIFYLIISTNRIYKFFNSYITSGYSYSSISNLAGSYINIFMYLAIIIILAVVLFIYYLMVKKKKNTKLYIGFIIYYIVLFVFLTIFHGILSNLEINTLSAEVSRTYRDISFLIPLPQYFFAFYSIFRGLGFDIKSFKFETDLKDLDIDEKDNEEFEFVLGVETYKYKRTARRFIREFRYYVLENKFIFTCLGIIAFLIISTTLYMHFNVFNKTYTKNKTFSHSAFTINMTNSILTNMDYNGKTITKDKYYLVLQLNITNNSISKTKLDISDFRLQIGKEYLVPTLDRTDYFIDYGIPYHGENINKNTNAIYNIVYELTKEQVKNNYKIKILENIEYGIGDLTAHYKILSINPKKIIKKDTPDTYEINQDINLNDTSLGNSTVKINNYDIKDSYIYNYELCTNGSCRTLNDVISTGYTTSKTKTTLLILDIDTKLDETTAYANAIKTINTFYENYFTVESDGIEYSTKNVTPSNLKDKIVLQTSFNITSANNLNLLITIRNKTYAVKLK